MRRLLYVVLGLALLGGAAWFAINRHVSGPGIVAVGDAPRGTEVASSRSGKRDNSALGMIELALNAANVVVGLVGIMLTLRGMRSGRRG